MKKILSFSALFVLIVLTFSSCFLVNRYVYTDKELAAHYEDKALKPEFRTVGFLDRKVHYAVMSKSDTLPLLVMVHGAPGAWYGYLNLVDDSTLQQHYKIVSVDRLGYGKSGYGKEELSIQNQAMAIQEVIEIENTSGKKVTLLSRSYGAPIAAWVAIQSPEEIEKLVMASPVIDPQREKFYWFSDLGNTKVVQWLLPNFLNVATREKFSHQEEMRRMQSEWSKLCTPTYVLVGEQDEIADTANYTFARRNITECPAVFMKLRNTGHQITHQRPGLIKDILLETPYDDMAEVISLEDSQGEIFCSDDFRDRKLKTSLRRHRSPAAEKIQEPALH